MTRDNLSDSILEFPPSLIDFPLLGFVVSKSTDVFPHKVRKGDHAGREVQDMAGSFVAELIFNALGKNPRLQVQAFGLLPENWSR
ncbi:MAG: hypothetical protein NTW19_25495 [Planctomycetota bacterium]|nr:hypothetical protein [Planctomycetota bacterium]